MSEIEKRLKALLAPNSLERDSLLNSLATPFLNFKKYFGFTLAEVLITLGIIGVVAAMTIPAIHGAILKHRVETGVKKFYSTMNNALRMYSVENGDLNAKLAFVPGAGEYASYQETLKILNTYFLPYIKYNSVEKNKFAQNGVVTNFSDGSSFIFTYDEAGGDMTYCIYPYNSGKCKKGKTSFQFQFSKWVSPYDHRIRSTNSIEPYIYWWDGTETNLKNNSTWGCGKAGANNGYCTKILQQNNWKFPKDYPIKF